MFDWVRFEVVFEFVLALRFCFGFAFDFGKEFRFGFGPELGRGTILCSGYVPCKSADLKPIGEIIARRQNQSQVQDWCRPWLLGDRVQNEYLTGQLLETLRKVLFQVGSGCGLRSGRIHESKR